MTTDYVNSYSPSELIDLNRTARSSGAIGSKPTVCTQYLIDNCVNPRAFVLDFGAGPKSQQANILRGRGFQHVYAYDIGKNYNPDQHVSPFYRSGIPLSNYDIVFASNVLNVQPDLSHLKSTISQLHSLVEHSSGILICNFPKKPRKNECSDTRLYDILMDYFDSVGHYPKTHLYVCGRKR